MPSAADAAGVGAGTRFICSSTAACVAEMFTFPIDTTRVRMQVAGGNTSMIGTARSTVQKQGLMAFWQGIPVACLRQFVQCGVNLSLYGTLRKAIGADKDNSLLKKGLAGGVSGASGALCAVPTDVVKVRMQADRRTELTGGQPRYQGIRHAFKTIYCEEGGIRALYRGALPTCGRSAALHSSGLGAYDGFKTAIVKGGWMRTEDPRLHLVSSCFSGGFSTAFAVPFDVIKTRVMSAKNEGGVAPTPLGVLRETVKNEGAATLFRGFLPTLARLGPWQMLWLCVYEQLTIKCAGGSKF